MVPMVLLKPNLCFFVRFVLDTTKKQKKIKKTFCCYNCLDFAERQIFLSVRGIFPRFHSGEKECLKTSSLSRLCLDNNDVSQHSFSPSWNLGKMQLTLGKICLTANLDNNSNKILFNTNEKTWISELFLRVVLTGRGPVNQPISENLPKWHFLTHA